MAKPLVSIITPTHARPSLLPLIYACVQRQDWPNVEWLVDDDSAAPSIFMQSLSDERVRYHHDPDRRAIGAKRNYLVEQARGEYIVHFDDDDYYSPQYITHMLSEMTSRGADLVKLSGFFLYNTNYNLLAYWNLMAKLGIHFVWSSEAMEAIVLTDRNNDRFSEVHLGFGFSYVYKRLLWDSVKFIDIDWNEDGEFIKAATTEESRAYVSDRIGLCLHLFHSSNSSRCFPQFLIPPFLVERLFPEARPHLRALAAPG
jgi:glycosyltransferase involved in cell wall biosynthesis